MTLFYDTCVWRKPTNAGLLLNFNEVSQNAWKSGLIMCLLRSAKKIRSTTDLYGQELKHFRHVFHNNEYSDWLINNTIEKFEKR